MTDFVTWSDLDAAQAENARLRAALARVEALAESADWCQECAISPEILAALRGDQ